VLRSEGGWSAILQLPQFHSDEDWAIELLRQQNILAYPGHFFDLLQPSCLVISLLPLPDVFADALARMLLVAEYS
jgi:aspartate/methionine/tyrosine aminotransferase